MKVYKSDLSAIGHTMYPENGILTIVMDYSNCLIELILLREILKVYGKKYKITCEEDMYYTDDDGNHLEDALVVTTNLPWTLYEQIKEGESLAN